MAKKVKRGVDSSTTSPATIVDERTRVPPTTQSTSARRPPPKTWSLLLDVKVRRAFYLVLLAAMYAPLSQLILAPVYGSIPSAVYHRFGVIVSAMLSFLIRDHVPLKIEQFFAAFVFWIPVLHLVLFQFSSVLGNPIGPLVTECLTTCPLIMMSVHFANTSLHELDLSFLSEATVEFAPSAYNYLLFMLFHRILKDILPTWMGLNRLFTRVGLQILAAATYAAILPKAFFWPALPAIAFTAIGDVHAPLIKTTELLNNTLSLYNYTLIDRQESLTGYISVLQDNVNNFRVMRCDHSLLGGEWLLPADSSTNNNQRKVAEPVYAVFTMLESVRLVDRGTSTTSRTTTSDEPERALTIGLGVGTAPSALIAHGINTTIIELDRTVVRFAMDYFNFPKTPRIYLGDAVRIIEEKKEEQRANYDYIIHDVFTGGAEPVDLFTFEFLKDLGQMLKDDGVIAINYAGDLGMSSTSMIYRTIMEVFPSCRVFREDEQVGDDAMKVKDGQGQFTNMVFICKKTSGPVTFRKPVEADYLGSSSRRHYMLPKHEVLPDRFQGQGELLTLANRSVLKKMHVKSAIGHWHLMRKVMPAGVWENW